MCCLIFDLCSSMIFNDLLVAHSLIIHIFTHWLRIVIIPVVQWHTRAILTLKLFYLVWEFRVRHVPGKAGNVLLLQKMSLFIWKMFSSTKLNPNDWEIEKNKKELYISPGRRVFVQHCHREWRTAVRRVQALL